MNQDESIRTLKLEAPASRELPVSSDEPSSGRLRAIAIILIVVSALGVGGYFSLVHKGAESENDVEFGVVSAAAVPRAKTNTVSPRFELRQVESDSALVNIIESPQLDATAKVLPPSGTVRETERAEVFAAPNDDSVTTRISRPESRLVDHVAGLPSDSTIPKTPSETLIGIVEADDLDAAVELLRDNRALANALDYENRPVLTYARNVEMAGLLIEAGADYEASTASGWTPLMWIAGRNGDTEVAKYLIELGAWVSIEDNKGMRPIHQAAFMGNHDLVSAFVDSGADINALDDTLVTPLHGAAWAGDIDGVTLYLSLGADATLQNKNGETPYDIARSRDHTDLLPLLDPEQVTASDSDTPMPTIAQTGGAGTRELNFSSAVRLGTIQVRDWGSTDYKAWESAGSAWGTVTVPVGKEVMLMVDLPRLESLSVIDPEAIQLIHIRDVNLGDDELKHLYHLKGMRRLTLSRTGVSKAAIEALREALPECTIRE